MDLRKQHRKSGHRTGQPSLKTEGFVVQSVRMTVDENNNVRAAAEKAGLSINSWAADALREAATEALKKKKRISKNGKASS
jgi:uncharacterized protein (DUF1778 family)